MSRQTAGADIHRPTQAARRMNHDFNFLAPCTDRLVLRPWQVSDARVAFVDEVFAVVRRHDNPSATPRRRAS
jgi:hypothetical protein